MSNTARRARTFTATALFGAVVIVAGPMTGCEGDPAPQAAAVPAAAPVRTPPPAKPAITSVADLMADLGIDERVMMAESKAPTTTADRIAVLEFFDAFARGDNESIAAMADRMDRVELSSLVDSGVWSETIAKVSEVELEAGLNPAGDKCVLAIFDVDGSYQPQLWTYAPETDGMTFTSVATPPDMINKLYGVDRIAVWYDILEKELALAQQPDEDVAFQVNLAEEDEQPGGGGPSAAPSSPGTAPSPGGGGGRRPPPPGGPRKPPGPG